MNLKTQKVTVQKTAQELFDILTDIKNFEKLMPSKDLVKFEITGSDSFLFTLKGTPDIELKIKEKNAPNQLVLGATSSKLPFTLTADIDEISHSKSTVQLSFSGTFNPMISMMIKGPIGKLIETLADNMSTL